MTITTTSGINPKERRELAALCGITDQFLYQVLTGRYEMSTEEAVRCEQVTNKRLRRWFTCQKSWAKRWPELTKLKGAPPIPGSEGEQQAEQGEQAASG